MPPIRSAWLLLVALGLVGPHGGVAAQAVTPPAPTATEVPRSQVPTALEVVSGLLDAGDMAGAYGVLAARLDAAPDDAEARTLATQVALGLGITGGNAPLRLQWLRTADQQGQRLLALRPDDPDAMAWAAAARGRLALAEDGAGTVVRLAEDVWAITGRLLEVAPDHPLGNHVRGKLNQEALRLSRMKRWFARLFFGFDLVGQASWSQAEAHLERAVAGDPGMVLFYLDLGDTYRLQGKTDRASATYRRGLAVPDRNPVDDHLKGIIRRRLERMQP